jgi:hypothetical protein
VANDLRTIGTRRTHFYSIHGGRNDDGIGVRGAPSLAYALLQLLPLLDFPDPRTSP